MAVLENLKFLLTVFENRTVKIPSELPKMEIAITIKRYRHANIFHTS